MLLGVSRPKCHAPTVPCDCFYRSSCCSYTLLHTCHHELPLVSPDASCQRQALTAVLKQHMRHTAAFLESWIKPRLAAAHQHSQLWGLSSCSSQPLLICRSPVQPVEVPLPGCSYNPDPEQHQDALAAAVAAELRKEAQQEASKALPQRRLEAPADPLAQLLDEGVAFEDEQTSDEDEGGQPGQPTTPGEVWKSAGAVGIGVVSLS